MPKILVIDRFFLSEKQAIETLETDKESIATQMEEMAEEQNGEEGLLEEVKNDKGKITKIFLLKRQKKIKNDKEATKELEVLKAYLKLIAKESEAAKKIKIATAELDKKVFERYKALTAAEIKTLVVDDKWMANIEKAIKTEMERISQRLTQRIKELAERYETPLPSQTQAVAALEEKVQGHLLAMGFSFV